jgi:alkanesulfonate monooxygenase SsuD/methylene tetrahydromethanopterin reductase-like flavin-dependent oxidoreductase (luciferase family)
MQDRLGLATIPAAGRTTADIRDIAQAAETAGFDSIFVADVNNDALSVRPSS